MSPSRLHRNFIMSPLYTAKRHSKIITNVLLWKWKGALLVWKCTKSIWQPGSARTHWGAYESKRSQRPLSRNKGYGRETRERGDRGRRRRTGGGHEGKEKETRRESRPHGHFWKSASMVILTCLQAEQSWTETVDIRTSLPLTTDRVLFFTIRGWHGMKVWVRVQCVVIGQFNAVYHKSIKTKRYLAKQSIQVSIMILSHKIFSSFW